MITLEELRELTLTKEEALEKAKEEAQKAEIEDRIDRAIKAIIKLSNGETKQITIHFGNEYPDYILQEVIEKYQAEGYFASLKTIGPSYTWEEIVSDPKKLKYTVDAVINWAWLIQK